MPSVAVSEQGFFGVPFWTNGKYFGVCQVTSFEGAADALHNELLMHVTYKVKAGTLKWFGTTIIDAQRANNAFA